MTFFFFGLHCILDKKLVIWEVMTFFFLVFTSLHFTVVCKNLGNRAGVSNLLNHPPQFCKMAKNEKFCQMLEATHLSEVYNMSDPDDSFKVFLREINPMLVDCFKRKKSPKRNIQRCVWYNRELLLLSRKKDRLYKIYLKKKTSSAKEKYHKFRNFYFHAITQKKRACTKSI